MIKLKKLLMENWLEQDWNTKYPVASHEVDGRRVADTIPNFSSIGASFNDYKILPGIREFPMSDLADPSPNKNFVTVSDFKRSENLAEQIEQSGWIAPLIIAIDKEGPYILEGAHRWVALGILKAKSFPAKIVLDLD
jgi:hypothetical protein